MSLKLRMIFLFGALVLLATCVQAQLATFYLYPSNTVVGGTTLYGVASFSPPAQSAFSLQVSSSNPSLAMPNSMIVHKGDTRLVFPIRTTAVATSQAVTITTGLPGNAFYGTASLSLTPAVGPKITSFYLYPSSTVVGGDPEFGVVQLSAAAPAGGWTITGSCVTTGSPNPYATLPNPIVVPAGQSKVLFPITTSGVSVSDVVSKITLISAASSSSAQLTEIPSPRNISRLYAYTSSTVKGGQPVTASVILDGPAPEHGIRINLNSDSPVATVPDHVTVPAGSDRASFTINTGTPVQTSTANITASAGASRNRLSVQVWGLGDRVSAFWLENPDFYPSSPRLGAAYVMLNGPAKAGGVPLTITTDPRISAPKTFTVPEGQNSASIPFNVGFVNVDTSVNISINDGRTTWSAAVLVHRPKLKTVYLYPSATVKGGQSVTGVVIMNGPVGPGGYTITLINNSGGIATVPSVVKVPGGADRVQFTITTNQVTSAVVCAFIAEDDHVLDSRVANGHPRVQSTYTVTP